MKTTTLPTTRATTMKTTKRSTTVTPTTAPPMRCYEDYTVYLPLDEDFKDRSCRWVNVCALGQPKLVTIGSDRVTSFDGRSYLELPSLNMRNAGHYVQNMTITVRFKLTRTPRKFAVILGNGEIDTIPSIDIHIDKRNRLVAGMNFVYFTPRPVSIIN